MADDSIISYSDLIGDDGTFDEILKNIKKIEKELISSAKRIKKEFAITNPNDVDRIQQLEKEVKELTQANKNLAKATSTVNKAKKKSAELTKEQLIQQEALKLEKREAVRIAKQQAIILKEEGNTIKSLRAQLSLATIAWSKLTAEELKNGKKGEQLANTKRKLTEELKALEKATGDNRRNVGNYSDALKNNDKITKKLANSVKRLRKDMMRVFVGRTIVDGVRNLVMGLGRLVDKFADSNAAIGGIQATIGKVTSAFEFAGTRILEYFAPAIERIGAMLFKLPAFFAGVGAAASQLGTNISSQFQKLALNLELIFAKIERNNPFSDKNAAEVEANIIRIERAIKSQTDRQKSLSDVYSETYDRVLKEQQEFIAEQEAAEKAAAAKKAKEIEDREKAAAQKQLEARIKAIESLNKELRRLEVENIKDATDKSIALENLRYEEEKKLRKAQLDELEVFFKENQDKLNEIADLRRDLDEESEENHTQNLLDIWDDYAQKRADQATKTVKTAQKLIKEQNEADNELIKNSIKGLEDNNETEKRLAAERSERIKKQKEEQQELIEQIGQTAEKIGQEIVNLLEKQADVAEENVNAQVENLDRARERAANGLEANLAFEEQELAKRQAEQKQKEKEAQQAAKLLTLFNLVSAYAQSGDDNALFRGLADFAILEAFSAGLQGFYEGTEDTGKASNALDNKGGRLAILHDNERVVTKAQNMLLNGMSNEDLVSNALIGEQMGDYFNPQGVTQRSLFEKQKNDFVDSMQGSASKDQDTAVVKQLQRIERQLAKQPNFSVELEKIYNDMYGLVQSEVRRGMKVTTKQKLRKRF